MIWKLPSSPKTPLISTEAELVEQLLQNRNLKSKKDRELFFNPDLNNFDKEFNITGIDKAKERIIKAVKNKEKIIVYGDYDVDGICATAIIYLALKNLGAEVMPYIPHREKEGYGLSQAGLEKAKQDGVGLIITVDNGIVALEQARFAGEIGLDLIITDHHVALDEKPKALAIVHSTGLSGAGVAWALVRHIIQAEESEKLLDLVAIATVADLLPLTGANRALVKKGLEVLNRTERKGLLALISMSDLEQSIIISYHVGHILSPRLNAMGRMEHSIDSLRLLCTNNPDKAQILARLLCDTNDLKRKVTFEAIREAQEIISSEMKLDPDQKVVVLESPKWIPGIIGLIAGRIAEEYHIPAIAISSSGDIAKGSARSVEGVDIVEVIRGCSDLLIEVGGHPQAAGFSIEKNKIDEFKKRVQAVMQSAEINREGSKKIEGLVDLKKVSLEWLEDIEQFEPFGMGNPQPLLGSKEVEVNDIKTVGQKGDHLKFKADGKDAIAFSFGKYAGKIKEGDRVDLAYYLELNKFNGRQLLQLKVSDIVLH